MSTGELLELCVCVGSPSELLDLYAERGRVSKAGRVVSILVLRRLGADLTLNSFYSTRRRP